MHFYVIFVSEFKILTPEQIDKFGSAEIPDFSR